MDAQLTFIESMLLNEVMFHCIGAVLIERICCYCFLVYVRIVEVYIMEICRHMFIGGAQVSADYLLAVSQYRINPDNQLLYLFL